MKRFIFSCFLLFSISPLINSCTSTGGIFGAAKTVDEVSNVTNVAREIANIFGVNLGLAGNTTSALTSVFSNYIEGTNGIFNLASTDKKGYQSKLADLNKIAIRGLTKNLGASNYTKFLEMLGSGKKKSLNNLTGGVDLSSSAKSILTGLLLSKL